VRSRVENLEEWRVAEQALNRSTTPDLTVLLACVHPGTST
jgi:hypothetical protein